MMRSNRADYASPLEWLSLLRQDEVWLSQLHQLQKASAADVSVHRDEAMRRIGKGETYEYWEIYQHQVEPAVREVWEIDELSLPKLKIQTIGMLSMEWIEQQSVVCQWQNAEKQSSDIIEQLKPVFYGSEKEAKAFVASIRGVKPKQITDMVNQLVSERKISDMSKHRDLWKILHDYGLYERSESNWNMQVK